MENEDAQLVLKKLVEGDYYKEMFHLNTEHIAVLEQKIENLHAQNQNLASINENLKSSIEVYKEEIRASEKRFKDNKREMSMKQLKTSVVIGLIGLSLGVLIGLGAI